MKVLPVTLLQMEAQLKKNLLYNIIGTLFLSLFGAIYEIFSHEVYSYFMIYAFAIPLLMGGLPYTILLLVEKYPDRQFLNIWNTAIATLSIGCAFYGVLAIYGTTNSLAVIYPIAGAVLMLLAFLHILGQKKAEKAEKA